jgi:Flp pilus assembly CpaE family ATPase
MRAVERSPHFPKVALLEGWCGVSMVAPAVLVASEDASLADEIIRHLEEFPHWSAAAASSLAQLRGALPKVSQGTLAAVWAPKGGSGASVIAAHLAAAVASLGPPPLLIDLDLDHADQTAILGVEGETKTVLDLIRVVDEITPAAIEGVARRHPSGFRAVLAPGSPGESGLVKPSEASALLRALREASDVVIVDLPSGWGELVPAVAEESNHFAIVVTPDLLSLRRSRDALRMLRASGLPSDRVRIFVNRWPGPAIGIKDVEAVLGSAPVATVRYDPQIEKASDRGELASLGIRQLEAAARRITGRPETRGRRTRRLRR